MLHIGRLKTEGQNVFVRQPDGTWLRVEPLGIASNTTLTSLRTNWVGRWVLLVHPDGSQDVGFVADFGLTRNGTFQVSLDDLVGDSAQIVTVEPTATMVHDPIGRNSAVSTRIERERVAALQAASDQIHVRAGVLAERSRGEVGDIAAARELEAAADLMTGVGIPVRRSSIGAR